MYISLFPSHDDMPGRLLVNLVGNSQADGTVGRFRSRSYHISMTSFDLIHSCHLQTTNTAASAEMETPIRASIEPVIHLHQEKASEATSAPSTHLASEQSPRGELILLLLPQVKASTGGNHPLT